MTSYKIRSMRDCFIVLKKVAPLSLCIFLLLPLLTGCVTLSYLAQTGDTARLEMKLNAGANINSLAHEGTPLGYASYFNNIGTVRFLIERGADIDRGNPDGFRSKTPLHAAAYAGHMQIVEVLMENGADPNIRNRENLIPAEMAEVSGHHQIASYIRNYESSIGAWKQCQALDTIECYANYIERYPNGKHITHAKEMLQKKRLYELRLEAERNERVAMARREQRGKLKEPDWIYTGNNSQSGYAHGKGSALHRNGELRFEGEFQGGVRTRGILYYRDTPLFDGNIVNGKPDGVGICFIDGEPEECKYYNGKRVDTLYKQRIELEAQRKYIELLKMEIEKTKSVQPDGQASAITDPAKDALKQKAASQAVSTIFNHLF